MQDVQPELVVGQPRGVWIAQQLLDLRADVDGDRGAWIVGLDEVHVDDEPGDVLDEPLKRAFDVRAGVSGGVRAVGAGGRVTPFRVVWVWWFRQGYGLLRRVSGPSGPIDVHIGTQAHPP